MKKIAVLSLAAVIVLGCILTAFLSPQAASAPAGITFIVTGAIPITVTGPLPTPAPYCEAPLDWDMWVCVDGRAVRYVRVFLPIIR